MKPDFYVDPDGYVDATDPNEPDTQPEDTNDERTDP
jgi:hypothetical protein